MDRLSRRASFKRDEAVVRVQAADVPEPLTFLVDRELVQPSELPPVGSEVEGRVKVILLRHRDDTALVEVPGEPISFGPKIVVTGEQPG